MPANNFFKVWVGLSLLAHIMVLFPIGQYGHYNLALPVLPVRAVIVDLAAQRPYTKSTEMTVKGKFQAGQEKVPAERFTAVGTSDRQDAERQPPAMVDHGEAEPATAHISAADGAPMAADRTLALDPAKATPSVPIQVPPPLRTIGEFTSTKLEQLSYLITLLGMPIGTAELAARNEKGEFRISLKVKSAPAISALYPVDDLIETRHIAGNFIITKIRQQEGGYRSNRGFTIFLREKRVFWMDLLRNRSLNETIPNDQVLDVISAFYYLRNRSLEVGKTEFLHVYDSNAYSLVPVDVLRREKVQLPAFRQANTIVVRPQLKTDGIFRRTGDVTIWLTDDEFKVPVRLETSIPLGHITAELVSAETEELEPTQSDLQAPSPDQPLLP